MLDTEKEVQGVALYAEWTKPGSLTQIFFTPDGYSNDGSFMRARMYRRNITAENPRKQWKTTPLYGSYEDHRFEEEDDKKTYSANRAYPMREYFKALIHGGWAMVNEPLLIEVSKKDMDDIQLNKTPNKFLYRVDLTKKAKGFPEPLLKNDEE
jgi:hypothetical protein